MVSAEKVLSRKNLAHHIAKSEMQYRRGRGWRPNDDYLPEPLPRGFQEVWDHVASSRRSSGMDTSDGFFARGYRLSDEVLSALDSLAGSA